MSTLAESIEHREEAARKLAATKESLRRGEAALAVAKQAPSPEQVSHAVAEHLRRALESGAGLDVPPELERERADALNAAGVTLELDAACEKLRRRSKVEEGHLESALKEVELAAEKVWAADSLAATQTIEALQEQITELQRALFADAAVYLRANGRAIKLSPPAYSALRAWNENPHAAEPPKRAEARRLAAGERFRSLLEPA